MVPLTANTGGTSKSDPTAGNAAPRNATDEFTKDPITTGDKAGAAILTILIIGVLIALSIWIVL